MIFLHIIFGMSVFIGALGLGVSFRDSFDQLTKLQKVAIILSYVGAIGSTLLGFMSTKLSPFVMLISIVLVMGFSALLLRGTKKKENNR